MVKEEKVQSATDADEIEELPGVFGQRQHTMSDEEHDERKTHLAKHKHGKKEQRQDDPFDFICGYTGVAPAKKEESGSLQEIDADD